MRSGMVTALLLTLLIGGATLIYRERGRGDLTRLQQHIQPALPQATASAPQPGGQDAVVLTRSQMFGGPAPQFLSVTLLPGRGMNTLQITAFLPGKGEIPLLVSPSIEAAAQRMIGTGADRNGLASLEMGAAPLVPWADRLTGTLSADRGAMTTSWHGEGLSVPASPAASVAGREGQPEARGGLLLERAADTSDSRVMPDGGAATAIFHAGNFAGHWPSTTDVTMETLLSGRQLELTITAKNTGTQAEPLGIGWSPRFLLPSGDRSQARLRVGAGKRLEVAASNDQPGRASSLPTGRLLDVNGTAYDLQARGGALLGPGDFDVTFADLKTKLLDSGPVVELNDPASGYGLRITALSSKIKAIHVSSPAGSNYVSISPQFNYDDPLGREWAADEDTGMQVLEPGRTVEWRVRLEMFAMENDTNGTGSSGSGTQLGPGLPRRGTLEPAGESSNPDRGGELAGR